MPPIEWPIRTVWTDGSMVGEGVEWATSISITLFSSLSFGIQDPDVSEDDLHQLLVFIFPATFRTLIPFSKSLHTVFQFSSGLKFGILDRHDVEAG